MQVSAISVNRSAVFGNIDKPDENSCNSETSCKTFTSSPSKKYSAGVDYDSIHEWKEFCQNQILSGNINYMA